MKKTLMAGIMALVLVVGGVGSLSAKGYGNGAMDGTGTGICTREDCPQDGSGAQQNRQFKGKQGGGQKLNQNADKERRGEGLRDGSCGDCVNDGVRPLDGSGMKKGRK